MYLNREVPLTPLSLNPGLA